MTLDSVTPTSTHHILIVDDDELIRILLKETFWIHSNSQVEIATARSVVEAREAVANGDYPTILFIGLNLKVEGKDGTVTRSIEPSLSFIQEVKRTHASTKVIVYSAHSEAELREQAHASGADVYIVKGESTPSEIVQIVENL